jgi:hypothetical protein
MVHFYAILIWPDDLSPYRSHCEQLFQRFVEQYGIEGFLPFRAKLIFIYRRPTLYPLEIAVDFLKSL